MNASPGRVAPGQDCERQQFLDMAKLWMTAARQLDDGMAVRSSPPAKARGKREPQS
jgi:hypothetical protein